jgi:hypothetical protein
MLIELGMLENGTTVIWRYWHIVTADTAAIRCGYLVDKDR